MKPVPPKALANDASYPRRPGDLPRGALRAGSYRVTFARSRRELEEVQRLRFQVFNVERGEGLAASFATGRDEDRFDAYCHHVMVVHDADGVVGTYRIMSRALMRLAGHFYAQGEYDLGSEAEGLFEQGIEIGRACVHRAHRNGRVILLLFRGLARYLSTHDKRYMFGCCSLPTLDEAAAWGTYRSFRAAGHLHESHRFLPLPDFVCSQREAPAVPVQLPALFASYLAQGAKVCSEPAVDRAFKVIDFFVAFDAGDLSPARRRAFYVDDHWKEP
jgi:putative hemolysin